MKTITAILLILLAAGANKIKIDEATTQEWVGGLQQSGYGTDYKLVIKVKAGSDKLMIDEMWVGDIRMPARAVKDLRDPASKDFKKGDVVHVRAGITHKPDASGQMRMLAGEKKVRPIEYSGEGLLGFTYKGKRGYLVIPSFKVLEKIIYP
jgi:hypothetical protein